MKWEDCTLVGRNQTGKDALGNPIFEKTVIKTCKARFTPWTNDEIQIEGREVTKNERKLLLRISFLEFPECSTAKIGDETYSIKLVSDLSPRFVLLHVKKYNR